MTKFLKVEGTEFRISQYADDTVLFLNGTEKSLQAEFKILDLFASMSGLKVNIEKTNAIWVGSKKGCGEKLCEEIKVNWVEDEHIF